MTDLAWSPKDPAESLNYSIDWSKALPQGVTIASAEWSATPAGLDLSSPSHAQKATTVWISGGSAGLTYLVTCEITTSAGQTFQRSVRLPVAEL